MVDSICGTDRAVLSIITLPVLSSDDCETVNGCFEDGIICVVSWGSDLLTVSLLELLELNKTFGNKLRLMAY